MSELISGKEALIALANGEKLQARDAHDWRDVTKDMPLALFDTPMIVFRIKPRTITINGIECQNEDEAFKMVKEFFR